MRLPEFPVEGGCVCGAVRYQLSAPPLGVYKCHCKDCQRSSGTGFTLSMVLPVAAFRVLRGKTHIYDRLAASGRIVRQHSCAICDTRIYQEPLASPEIVTLRPGTLDDFSWVVPVGNIWTASKAIWVEIDPAMPNFPGQPSSRQGLFDAWILSIADGD